MRLSKQGNFFRVFKKEVGVTPNNFRTQVIADGA